MKSERCHLHKMVRIVFKKDTLKEHRLVMFDDVLEKITEGIDGKSIADRLLHVRELKLCVNRQDVVLSATVAFYS